MNDYDIVQQESARSGIYKHLAKCYQLPGDDLEEVLKTLEQQLIYCGSDALSHVVLMRSSYCAATDRDSLAVEYAKLFVGPYSILAPPYGSVYLENQRRIMGPSTLNAIRCYRDAGLEVASDFKDAPDHIAVELEFMHFLVFKELEALEKGNREEILALIACQHQFLQNHLGCWIQAFARSIKAETRSEFYRNLADAARIYINEDLELLNQSCIHEAAH